MAKAAATPTTVFTWKIANLERETADGFVMTAHYTISAEDGTYSSGAYGSLGFERPDNLTPRRANRAVGQGSPWRRKGSRRVGRPAGPVG
jgi:hypothetical protein